MEWRVAVKVSEKGKLSSSFIVNPEGKKVPFYFGKVSIFFALLFLVPEQCLPLSSKLHEGMSVCSYLLGRSCWQFSAISLRSVYKRFVVEIQ